jgi:hypothetical protein
MPDDENIEWLNDPTQVTEFDVSTTPTRVVTELPGYEIGYNNGYAQGRLDGREDAKVKDWLDGVNMALLFFQRWLTDKDVPYADHIVADIKAKLFKKP